MNVLAPHEWGAQVDYDEWNDRYTPDDGVALHHGGSGDYSAGREPYAISKEVAQLRNWESYHLSKGWRGLAYGWGVGQTGTLYRIRGWNGYGAHTGDVDGDGIANNSEIVPIIFLGSGNWHDLSQAAMNAIGFLRREIIQVRAPAARYLYGHQELGGTATSCPGPKLMTYVRSNRYLSEEDDMPLSDADIQSIYFHRINDLVTGEARGAAFFLAQARSDAFRARVASEQALALVKAQAELGDALTPAEIDAIAAEVAERVNAEAIAEAVADEQAERLAS